MGKEAREQSPVWRLLEAGLLGYGAGSISTSDLVSAYLRRKAGGRLEDLRQSGSRNPGALNAAKVLGRKWGLAVMAGDMLKGAMAALLGRAVASHDGSYAAATMAVVGHCFPAWNGFRGGKGVATSFGSSLACFPVYAPVDLTVAAASFLLSRGPRALSKSPDAHPAARIGTYVASAAFTVAAFLWWRTGKRNLWGPAATVGLPLYAAITSAVIALRFKISPSLAPASNGAAEGDEPVGAEAWVVT